MAYWKAMDTRRGVAWLEEVGHWRCAHEGCGPFLLLPLLPGHPESSNFALPHAPCHDGQPHQARCNGTNPLKPLAKINL
jgi:hypothetical protein